MESDKMIMNYKFNIILLICIHKIYKYMLDYF